MVLDMSLQSKNCVPLTNFISTLYGSEFHIKYCDLISGDLTRFDLWRHTKDIVRTCNIRQIEYVVFFFRCFYCDLTS